MIIIIVVTNAGILINHCIGLADRIGDGLWNLSNNQKISPPLFPQQKIIALVMQNYLPMEMKVTTNEISAALLINPCIRMPGRAVFILTDTY